VPKPLKKLTASEARRLLAEGQFPLGSMGPKVEAAVEFAEARARAGCTDCYAAIGRSRGRGPRSRGEERHSNSARLGHLLLQGFPAHL